MGWSYFWGCEHRRFVWNAPVEDLSWRPRDPELAACKAAKANDMPEEALEVAAVFVATIGAEGDSAVVGGEEGEFELVGDGVVKANGAIGENSRSSVMET